MNKPISSITPPIKSMALAVSLVAFIAPAQASILTFSDFTFTAADPNLSSTNTLSSDNNHSYNRPYISSITNGAHNDIINAKPGVEGSVKLYTDVTTTTITDHVSYKDDGGTYAVQGNPNLYSTPEWIQITGVVHASEATTFSLSLAASGNYTAISGPGGAQLTPALPSLFWVNGAIYTPAPLSDYTNPGTPNTYSVYQRNSYNITASAAENFTITALIYAQSNISLANYALSIFGSSYDNISTSSSVVKTVSTLFSTTAIDALPVASVPLPAAVWLFGSGLLGLTGFARKRKTA